MRTFFRSPFRYPDRSNNNINNNEDDDKLFSDDDHEDYDYDNDCALLGSVTPKLAVEAILMEASGAMGPVTIKLTSSTDNSPRSAIVESETSKGKFRDVSNSFPLLSSQWTKPQNDSILPTSSFPGESTPESSDSFPVSFPTNPFPFRSHSSRTLPISRDIAELWMKMESSPALLSDTKISSNDHAAKAMLLPPPRIANGATQRVRPRPEMIRSRPVLHSSRVTSSSQGTNRSNQTQALAFTNHGKTTLHSYLNARASSTTKTAPSVSDPPAATRSNPGSQTTSTKPSQILTKSSLTKSQKNSMNLHPPAATKWRSAVDPKSGRTYYYHLETRETQWRKPMELATKEERAIMEEKDRRQREFFSQMEANILKSMSQGVIPGVKAAVVEPKKEEPVANSTSSSSSHRRGSLKRLPRPKMVRTISSMDEKVLVDLVTRVPSHRHLLEKDGDSSRRESLAIGDLGTLGEESVSDSTAFATSAEMLDSLPTEEQEVPKGNSLNEGTHNFQLSSPRFHRGLTWEESRALQKLAEITEEMSHMPESPTLSGLEITEEDDECDDDCDDSLKRDAPPPASTATSTSTAASSRSGSPRDSSSPPMSSIKVEKSSSPTMKKPDLKRRNTCGTLYVGSTMSAPDKDATIKCICGVYRAHILQSEAEEVAAPLSAETEQFRIFNDQESQQRPRRGIGYERRRSMEHKRSVGERPPPPELEEICFFYRDVFRRAQMESDCIIMSLIYVERLIKSTDGALRPRTSNWRSLLFSCMVLASKVWDDLSMWNADFSQACPPGVRFPLQRINELEVAVLQALKFTVKVPASEYAKYYFLLRSMLIKSGLGGDDVLTNTPLDVEGARRMQQLTAQFQATATTKSRVAQERCLRSKSLTEAEKQKMQEGARRMLDIHKNKVSLEHMVKM